MDKLEKPSEKKAVEDEFSFKSLFIPLTDFTAIHIIVILGLLVFSNALFNNFVFDDVTYILNTPTTHIVNLAISFGPNLFNSIGQYRPIPATYFSILYALFGTTPFPYHLLQLLLHIACTILLYVLFRRYLSSGIALFLTMIFLIHPMQVESVSFISQSVSPLFFLFGIISLLILMRKDITTKTLAIALFLLLLSLLTKETGVLFLALALMYNFLFNRNNLYKLLVGDFIILVIYVAIRLFIGHIGFETRHIAPIADISLTQRLINTPMIMFYYLKTFLFPKTLAIMQHWVIHSVTFSTFYLPLFADIVFFTFTCIAGVYIYKLHKHDLKAFLFFSVWFFLGMILHINIFPLDMTVADRWFYFPMAGFLGFLGILYQNIAKKRPSYLPLSLLFALLIILSLSLRTVVRNSDWQNNMKLFSHDIEGNDNFDIESFLGGEYANRQEYDEALLHYQRSFAFRPLEIGSYNIALTYLNMNNVQQARNYLIRTLNTKNHYKQYFPHAHALETYKMYASILVLYDNDPSAVLFLNRALSDYPDSADLWAMLALAKFRQNDKQGALEAASRAIKLDPNGLSAYVYSHIQDESITITFNERPFILNAK